MRNKRDDSLPIYDSMASCAGATGIVSSTIRRAKRDGCDAFVGSRVYLGPLVRWMDEQLRGAGEQVDDRARKLCAEADLAEVEVAKARGELVLITDVERWAGGVVTALRQGILGSSLLDAEKDELIAHLRKLLERSATPAGGDDAEVGAADGATTEADR